LQFFAASYRNSPPFGAKVLLVINFLQKMGLGYILGDFFSQTHLVTLHQMHLIRVRKLRGVRKYVKHNYKKNLSEK
jgi:hypothetical protein